MIEMFEDRFSGFVLRRRWAVLAVYVVICLLSGFALNNIKMDADFLSMLDSRDKSVNEYKYVLKNFGSTDAFVVVLREDASQAAVQSLTETISVSELVDSVSPPHRFSSGITVLSVLPAFNSTDLGSGRLLSDLIKKNLTDLDIKPELTGSCQVLLESARSTNRDMTLAVLITFAAVSLLLVFLRIPARAVLSVAAVLLAGLLFTFAFAALFSPRIALITATLPAVLLGLGVDFSLHLLYAVSSRCSSGTREPVKNACRDVIRPLLIASCTTALAFASLCFAGSDGLAQFGLIGAAGILIMSLLSLTLLPALLSFCPQNRFVNMRGGGRHWLALARYLAAHPRRLAAGVALVLIIGGLFSSRLSFSTEQNDLADTSLPAYQLQKELLEECGFSPAPVMFVSPDALTEQLKTEYLLTEGVELFNVVQNSTIALAAGLDASRFIAEDGTLLTLAYPIENPFESAPFLRLKKFADEASAIFTGGGNLVTGGAFINYELASQIKRDLLRCVLAATVLVVSVLLLGLKKPFDTALALTPVCLGLLLTGTVMALAGMSFSILTIVVFPLLLGAGIDDGVHLISRCRSDGSVAEALGHVCRPILATTLTSVFAFASLLPASNPGFRALAVTAVSGFIFCLLITLVVLPAIIAAKEKCDG
ncbi:MAG: RND family transporter [Phycisphaerae bacterium]